MKKDWGFKGWVMSDWGARTVPAANAGLDQQSGMPFDLADYFGPPLKEAVLNGWAPQSRLDDMVRRILHAMPRTAWWTIRWRRRRNRSTSARTRAVSRKDAVEGMVLLKNSTGALAAEPLGRRLR
nr:hypothetical protein [Duganella sp. BJB1802]